jgi:ligand-binding sensor domain-containing protein
MNRLIPILLTVILLFPVHYVFSQGIWKTYTRADGLAGDTVTCIIQDKLDNYWIGTWGSGMSMLNTNGLWTNFFTDSITYAVDIEIDELNNKWFILARSGKTYVVKYNDSTFTYYSPGGYPKDDPKPMCLGQDSSGHIWCGTTTGLVFWFDGLTWHPIEVIPNSDYSWIREIKLDRNGNLYFAHDKGISMIKDGQPMWIWGAWIYVTSDIAFDKQNRLWFSLLFEEPWGLGMFDGNNWRLWSTSDGLLENDVWAVAIDSNNFVWIANGSYGYNFFGVSQFDGITFTHFNHEQGLTNDNVWNIYVDKIGQIWFATRGGVSVLQDTTTSSVELIEDFATNEKQFNLFHNYPNPFNAITTIRYELNKEDKIVLTIHNLTGKEVITLVNKQQPAGLHQVVWNGTNNNGKEVSSGIYIAVLTLGKFKKSIKLTLIR